MMHLLSRHRHWLLTRGAPVAVLAAVAGTLLMRSMSSADPARASEKITEVKAEHVRSGHSVKLDPDDKLIYAGIRAPYEGEPLFEESRRRNAELVEGKTLRLRYDRGDERDKEGRLVAYAFIDEQFINELLVREGLAYVRLTTDQQRYAPKLLTAQKEARKLRRGVWKDRAPGNESRYPGDPKYGNFHRPGCEEVPRIKPDRFITYKRIEEALDAGCAPCPKCRP